MHEELLQFIWNKGLFNAIDLHTADGQPVTIEARGLQNNIAGPDFSDARVRIADTLWVGSVELHTRSSEWIRHTHQDDAAYDNVILHVVYEHDIDVRNSRGETVPVIELAGRIPHYILGKYETLRIAGAKIPCGKLFPQVSKVHFLSWLDRVLVERLERKSGDIEMIHMHNGKDWLQTFYVLVAGYLGQNRNKLPFQELARELPVKLLLKYRDQPLQVEAMLFGAAGLLPRDPADEYTRTLATEYDFLKSKHQLREITQQWRFGGIRPSAFPTLRIALLAALVPHIPLMQAQLVAGKSPVLPGLSLTIHPYWKSHYTFKQTSPVPTSVKLGEGLVQVLTINAFAPYLFYYARFMGDEQLAALAIGLLQDAEPEQNAVSRTWKKNGFEANNASESQALIELTTQYCNVKKCVLCNVGKQLISSP